MNSTTTVITVATATVRVQVQATQRLVAKVLIEPLRANTGRILVGTSTVAVAGTGLISDLTIPSATTLLDRYFIEDTTQANTIDLSTFWLDATVNGDKAKVTYWTN